MCASLQAHAGGKQALPLPRYSTVLRCLPGISARYGSRETTPASASELELEP